MLYTQKHLIINADDFNLSGGVSRGITEAIDAGSITSTTVLVTERKGRAVSRIRHYKTVSIGLHVNLTFGKPVSHPREIQPLCEASGTFKKRAMRFWDVCDIGTVEIEIRSQIERFCAWFGRMPSHLDSHHHIHSHPRILQVMKKYALEYGCALRKNDLDRAASASRVPVTDFSLYRFDSRRPWDQSSLCEALTQIRPGVTELIVHPGRADATLMKKSTFNRARETELRALLSKQFKEHVARENIRLMAYADLKNVFAGRRSVE